MIAHTLEDPWSLISVGSQDMNLLNNAYRYSFQLTMMMSRVGSIYIADMYHWYISDIYPIIFVRKYRIFSIFSIFIEFLKYFLMWHIVTTFWFSVCVFCWLMTCALRIFWYSFQLTMVILLFYWQNWSDHRFQSLKVKVSLCVVCFMFVRFALKHRWA